MISGVTVAICTKHRPEQLMRCIASVAATRPRLSKWEVLIVDDGELPGDIVDSARGVIGGAGGSFRYASNTPPGGLFLARIRAVQLASFGLIVFLDDDVEVLHGYFDELQHTYNRHPSAVGVGGVDVLMESAPLLARVVQYLFLHRARAAGRLSWSGFGGSMDQWRNEREPFRSEFLSGCNMSFNRASLLDLDRPGFFSGYSLGEDLYLSWFARKHGTLIVNPQLRVRHWSARRGASEMRTYWHAAVTNHWYLLLLTCRRPLWLSAVAFVWSVLGFATRSILATAIKRLKGDRCGAKTSWQVVSGLVTGIKEIGSGRPRGPHLSSPPRHAG